MEHFSKDVMKFTPAPTLAREIPVTIANLLFSIIGIAILIAVSGGVDALVIGFAVVMLGYSLGRTAYVAVRGPRYDKA
ncbi:hypothetical protein [Dietzia timorensis]|uniref:Uncharacterized protein n=1 Tax=Dietzia timorensis TaxID=499555 RepID=A0A173LPC0_9ACTN|nr:hypothetical protein [Dietzia timorensis]ANI93499.1 Hypothetical protein BJL86_2739 [Dietzia timorensis]